MTTTSGRLLVRAAFLATLPLPVAWLLPDAHSASSTVTGPSSTPSCMRAATRPILAGTHTSGATKETGQFSTTMQVSQ